MKDTRALVTTLLIGSIIGGFIQGLPTHTVSGVITTTSTTTSTYYSYWTGTTVSTRFMITTARTLTQTNYEGPYVKLDGPIRASYYSPGGLLQDFFFNLKIWNLLKVPVESGELLVELYNSAKTVTETLRVSFASGGIKVDGYVVLEHRAPVTKNFYESDAYWRLLRIEVVCGGAVVEAPVATYTLAGTQTYTYVRTYTNTYTASEPQASLGSTGGILVFAVAAIAVILIVAAFRIRGKAHAPPVAPSPISPPPETPSVRTKHCPECGFVVPLDAKNCSKCGAKQEYFGED